MRCKILCCSAYSEMHTTWHTPAQLPQCIPFTDTALSLSLLSTFDTSDHRHCKVQSIGLSTTTSYQ